MLDEFKEELQQHIESSLGIKVSKQKAWDLFKELVYLPFDYAGEHPDEKGQKRLSLSGVGVWEHYGSKSGKVVPKFRPSVKIKEAVAEGTKLLSKDVSVPEKVKSEEKEVKLEDKEVPNTVTNVKSKLESNPEPKVKPVSKSFKDELDDLDLDNL